MRILDKRPSSAQNPKAEAGDLIEIMKGVFLVVIDHEDKLNLINVDFRNGFIVNECSPDGKSFEDGEYKILAKAGEFKIVIGGDDG